MKYSLRNFLVVFLLSIVIFSVAAVFLWQYISSSILAKPENTAEETVISTEGEENGKETVKNSLSYLILGLDDDGRAAYLLLTHIDKDSGIFFCSDLPANLRLELDGEARTLGDAAVVRDLSFVREKVYALTAVKPDYLFTVEAEGFRDLVDRFGGFDFNVPQAMQESAPERGISIDLAAGNQHLDGAKALQVLQFSGYAENPEVSRSATFRAMIGAMCRGILSREGNLMKASEMLDDLYADVTTDMAPGEASAFLETLFAYPNYEVQEWTYPGTSEGEWFLPDTTGALDAYKSFR